MKKVLNIAVATPLIKVGNLKYNADEIIKVLDESKADLVLFPELNLTSLYCGDLFLKDEFLDRTLEEANRIIKTTKYSGLFTIGLPLKVNQYVINGLLVVNNNKVIGIEMKETLTLEEQRYFDDFIYSEMNVNIFGKDLDPFGVLYKLKGLYLAITLDGMYGALDLNNYYLSQLGADVILHASGDYEVLDSGSVKVKTLTELSSRFNQVYVYASPSKSESSSKYVYAGDMIICQNGEVIKEATNLYDNENYIELAVELNKKSVFERADIRSSESAEIPTVDNEFINLSPYPFLEGNDPFVAANVLNTLLVQAMIKKIESMPKHLQKVIIGVSGGADSTLALLVAEQALEKMGLPPTNLIGVSMPSENSLEISSKRALELIDGVKATKLVIPIDKHLKVHLEAINHTNLDTTYENAQARIRTNILMDLCNKYGGFMVGPSDLSEIALGFTTYNGDASSMYGINSGIPKTMVLTILEFLSKEVYLDLEKVIYEVSQAKPSPELLKNQVTEDVLGRYDINDFILYHFIKNDWGRPEFLKALPEVFKIDLDEAKVYVNRFLRRFYQNQFKRNVLPEGPNVLDISLNPRDGFRLAGDNEVDY